MKIYVTTDLEGVSGVCRFFQTREAGPRYDEACRLLMGDVRACVEGLQDAGVDEIIVRDGHGKPYNFVPELMAPGATYGVGSWEGGAERLLDESVDGIVFLAYHAMHGTPDGVLYHTQSSKAEKKYWYNGRESGEMAQGALIAGHFGIPPIMATGDDATCREARDFFGDEIVTVSVKTGLSREGAVLIAPEEAHELIRAGAKEAVARVPRCTPYKIDLPIRGKMVVPIKEYADRYAARMREGTTRVDDQTFEATFDGPLDILKF